MRLNCLWPVRSHDLFALVAFDLLFGGKLMDGYPGLVEVSSNLDAHRLAPQLPIGGIERYGEERAKGTPDNYELTGMIVEELNVFVLKSCGPMLCGSF